MVKRLPMKAELAKAKAQIEAADHITIFSHARPDGDAVGTLLGFMHSLELLGKHVTPVLHDGVPHRFCFLPGTDRVVQSMPENPGLTIVVDSSDLERLGFEPANLATTLDLNIDHHATNTYFAAINLVNPDAAAAAELLFDLAPELGLPMDERVANCWLMALITDTLGFRTPSVSARTLEIAAKLVEAGANMPELYLRGLQQHRFVDLEYWAKGLGRISRRGQLAWTTLKASDREEVGYDGNDDADLINLLSAIEGVVVSVIFVEQNDGTVKVSWRSHAGYDVAPLATKMGGGGHAQAAGAMIVGCLNEVVELVMGETEKVLSPRTE